MSLWFLILPMVFPKTLVFISLKKSRTRFLQLFFSNIKKLHLADLLKSNNPMDFFQFQTMLWCLIQIFSVYYLFQLIFILFAESGSSFCVALWNILPQLLKFTLSYIFLTVYLLFQGKAVVFLFPGKLMCCLFGSKRLFASKYWRHVLVSSGLCWYFLYALLAWLSVSLLE